MNLRLQPDTLPCLRLPAGPLRERLHPPKPHCHHWATVLAVLKTLIFFGLILPLMLAGALLFLATFGP